MRIFSGAKTTDFPTPPKIFAQDEPSSGGSSPTSRRSSFAQAFSSPKLFSGSSSPKISPTLPQENSTLENLSPELVPIVTLLSAHAHRRYCEGVFLMLQDLKSDGSSGSRKWEEVYGLLAGTQLALWDANELASCNSNESKPKLKQVASKPRYVNFADAIVRPLDGSEAVITESNEKLQNTLVVSTTLKNRYFLQYSDKDSFNRWNAAIQLSLFECTSLQEAYTGAFLSSRGGKLGDIKTLLADSKFDYEDWVSVRFGTGMPWRRCYAVIYQSQSRKKNALGHISFYENDKKTKKGQAIATIVTSNRLYAVYPSSPLLIDTSTIIKLEGTISFEKKDTPQDTNVFIMPEKHQAVPGYDTIIRFLVPAMNAFKLYGRPKKLIANKEDFRSLLFGLPTLPHVHYLKVEELLPLASSDASSSWTSYDWAVNIKEVLQTKMSNGYSGCGTSAGVMGAMSSPVISSFSLGESSPSLLPKIRPDRVDRKNKANLAPDSPLSLSKIGSDNVSQVSNSGLGKTESNNGLQLQTTKKNEVESVAATSVYSEHERSTSKSPGNIPEKTSGRENRNNRNSPDSVYPLTDNNKFTGNEVNPKRNPTTKSQSELDNIYHKYSLSPFGKDNAANVSPQVSEHLFDNPYKHHTDEEKLNIPKLPDSAATTIDEEREIGSSIEGDGEVDSINEEQDALREFNDLAKRINELNIGATPESDREVPLDKISPWDTDLSSTEVTRDTEDNVFDPDFMEQAQMLETGSRHTGAESVSDVSSEGAQTWQDSREVPTNEMSNLRQVSEIEVDRYESMPNPGRRRPPPQAINTNSYAQRKKPAPLSAAPYGHRQQVPPSGNHPQQGYMQPMVKSGGFPSNNYQRPGPYQQHHYNPHNPSPYNPQQARPYGHSPAQQQFPQHAGPYQRYYNGPPPQQRMPLAGVPTAGMVPNGMAPGGVAPRQQMHPQAGRAGPYQPPLQQMAKPKPATGAGFSKYMPSAAVNPYAQ